MDEKLMKLFQQLSLLAIAVIVIVAAFNWNTPKRKFSSRCWSKGNNDQGKFGARYAPSGVVAEKAEGLGYFPPVIAPQTRY